MTKYQLNVLRSIVPDPITHGAPTTQQIAMKVSGWGYPGTGPALAKLERAGLVYSVMIRAGVVVWSRTRDGDAALEDAEQRMIPKEPIDARLF